VASLNDAAARADSPRLLWIGRDLDEFDRLADSLAEAQIPTRIQRAFGGLLGSIMQRMSTIHVLSADFDRSLQTASATTAFRQGVSAHNQVCYSCSTPCSAFLAVCPHCQAQLIAPVALNHEVVSAEACFSQLKCCPLCNAEYVSSFDHCTVCGVALVLEQLRGRPLNEKERKEPIEAVWRGGDPAAISNVIAILREAGIRHYVQASSDHLVFELAMPRPKYIVRIFHSDVPRVRELLVDVEDSPFFGAAVNEESPEGSESKPSRPREVWNPNAARAEIWLGEDTALGNLFEVCLSENRIPFRRDGISPGTLRYFVLPSDESQAREILREVREGTPLA
jgi:hypothetical protein